MTRGFLHFERVLWNELPAFATKNLAFQKEANLIEDRGACAPRHYSQALSARDDIKMTCVYRTRLKLVARIAQKIAEALPRESIFSVHAPCWVLYCNKVRIFSKDISFTYFRKHDYWDILRYCELLWYMSRYESRGFFQVPGVSKSMPGSYLQVTTSWCGLPSLRAPPLCWDLFGASWKMQQDEFNLYFSNWTWHHFVIEPLRFFSGFGWTVHLYWVY